MPSWALVTRESLRRLQRRRRGTYLTTLKTRPELAPLRETLPFLTILADLGLSP
jgi:hypothetical protein